MGDGSGPAHRRASRPPLDPEVLTSIGAIRVAGVADLPGIVALVESAYRGDFSRSGWTTEADLIDGQRTDAEMVRASLVAVDQAVLMVGPRDRPLACCSLAHRGGRVWLGMFAVAPARQAEGLGDLMLRAAELHALRRWDLPDVHLTVIAQRPELIDWYEHRGYVKTGEIEPFPYGDERFGRPRQDDLELLVMRHRVDRPDPR